MSFLPLTEEQNRLVEKNIRLAYFIAKNFYNTSYDKDDLDSIAGIGLIKASQTFDESKGIKFATYATRCITNEILMFLRRNRKHEFVHSLDEVVNTDFEGNTLTYADIIPDPNSDFTEAMITKDDFEDDFEKLISITLNLLKGKHRIVTLYKFANKKQREIGDLVGVSQSYVARLYQKNFLKIKDNLDTDFKKIFLVEITDFFYRISFLSSNVPCFNQAYANLLKSNPNIIAESQLNVSYENERTTIRIPAELESFSYIAKLFQELDKFPINYTQSCSVKYDSTKTTISNSTTTINVKSNSNQQLCSNVDKKIDPMEKIRDYFLSFNSFTIQELKETFSEEKLFTIRSAIHSAEITGLVTPIGKGKYIVNKTKL